LLGPKSIQITSKVAVICRFLLIADFPDLFINLARFTETKRFFARNLLIIRPE
jgi:hypothetical protein